VQPVSLEDVARLSVEAADGADEVTLDAAGPERLTFAELVRELGRALGRRRLLVPGPTALTVVLTRVLGAFQRDVLLTREEIAGLADELLVSHEPARGRDSFRAWVAKHGSDLGRVYASELARNYR
jgi:uncharacterized protein YbjT (DUF2867 family)